MKFQFSDYTLRPDTRQLLQLEREVHLSPKAFELLKFLLEQHPTAVSKSELLNRLSPGVFVAEGILSVLVNEIRGALDDDADNPRFIRTLRGFGYAFGGDLAVVQEPAADSGVDGSPYWLIWATKTFRLAPYSSVLGREPGVEVLLDCPGVSRRHARITIDKGQAVIEDLDSKNGTYVGRCRIASPSPLADGDHIQLGPVVLVFRIWSVRHGAETVTVKPTGR
jgi:DNA-binding winged helix-turn-helix (wHTH) protein